MTRAKTIVRQRGTVGPRHHLQTRSPEWPADGRHLRGPYHRTVDVHIVHLREKLSEAGATEPRILTVRGAGDKLAVADPNIRVLEKLVLTPMAWPWLGR